MPGYYARSSKYAKIGPKSAKFGPKSANVGSKPGPKSARTGPKFIHNFTNSTQMDHELAKIGLKTAIFVPNPSPTSPSTGYCKSWNGCVKACRLCLVLLQPLPYSDKLTETHQQQ